MKSSKYSSNAWKKFCKDDGKETLQLKEMFRQLARQNGCGCVEEEVFKVNFHDTNPLAEDKVIPFPVDLYITREKPPHKVIVEIDGAYHHDPARQYKDKQRDEAITARYGIPIVRFDKEKLLKGEYSEQEIVEMLGIA